ncbi:MAG: TolC family protein [Synechococcales bacterium]|nr:TolC family protein [Synechococcales bacterium]
MKRGRSLILLGIGILGSAILGAITPTWAQTTPPVPTTPPPITPSTTTLDLTLPQLITLVIEGNRDLRNQTLNRIVQQQELREAERRFAPDFTPRLSFEATQQLSRTQTFGLEETDRTTTDESLLMTGEMLTRIGTTIRIDLDPIDDEQPLQLTLRQPLLRGFGRRVNEAPVEQARIGDQRGQLALQQEAIATVTEAIVDYTALIQAQEAVKIQADALARRQAQYDFIAALVQAGRRPTIDLVEAEGNIANAQRDLQDARNLLAQANTDLLDLIGTDRVIEFTASVESVEELFGRSLNQVPESDETVLIETAYARRPDYRIAQLAIEAERLGLIVATNNRRWQLDLEGSGTLGDTSDASVGLVLTREFTDESLETAQRRSQVNLLQEENDLAQLTDTIRNEVVNRLGDVRSNQRRLEAAQRATESAQLQLEADRERFGRGRSGTTLFDLTQREEALVTAQNAELTARIGLLNSIVELEQAIGITLDRWEARVDFTPVFEPPDLP